MSVAVVTKRPASGDIVTPTSGGPSAASMVCLLITVRGLVLYLFCGWENTTPRLNETQVQNTIPVDPASASGNPEVLNQVTWIFSHTMSLLMYTRVAGNPVRKLESG